MTDTEPNIRQAFESTKFITIQVVADVDLITQPITISLTGKTTQGPFTAIWVGTSVHDTAAGTYSRSARYLRAASSVPRGTYKPGYNLTDNPETGPDPVDGTFTIY